MGAQAGGPFGPQPDSPTGQSAPGRKGGTQRWYAKVGRKGGTQRWDAKVGRK